MDKKKRMWLWAVIVVIVVAVIIIGIIQYRKYNTKKKIDNALKPDVSAPAKSPDFKPKEGNRPERNNNPFNLRLTGSAWNGKVPNDKNTDGAFEQFYEKKYGVRAGIKNIITKVAKQGKNTLETLLAVYAPPSENDTTAYINQVSQWTGIMPKVPFEPNKDVILKLAGAIAKKEGAPLTDNELSEAYSLI